MVLQPPYYSLEDLKWLFTFCIDQIFDFRSWFLYLMCNTFFKFFQTETSGRPVAGQLFGVLVRPVTASGRPLAVPKKGMKSYKPVRIWSMVSRITTKIFFHILLIIMHPQLKGFVKIMFSRKDTDRQTFLDDKFQKGCKQGGLNKYLRLFWRFFSKIPFLRNHEVLRCQKNIYRELRCFFTRFWHYFEFLRRLSIFMGTCINRFDVKNCLGKLPWSVKNDLTVKKSRFFKVYHTFTIM